VSEGRGRDVTDKGVDSDAQRQGVSIHPGPRKTGKNNELISNVTKEMAHFGLKVLNCFISPQGEKFMLCKLDQLLGLDDK
jgi:hypothetical protein